METTQSDRRGFISSYGMDILAVALLVWACFLLADAGEYHRYSYYEGLRNVVFIAWIVAALRFVAFRWFVMIAPCAVIAWLFNPIFPVTMRKWEWQPYDHLAMLLSLSAAVCLVVLSFRARKLATGR